METELDTVVEEIDSTTDISEVVSVNDEFLVSLLNVNEAILNRLELIAILLIFITTLCVYNTLRRKRNV